MLQALLLALHLPKSHTEAITRVPQIVTYAVIIRRKEWNAKKNKGSCCSWRKGTSPDEATLNSEEIKVATCWYYETVGIMDHIA